MLQRAVHAVDEAVGRRVPDLRVAGAQCPSWPPTARANGCWDDARTESEGVARPVRVALAGMAETVTMGANEPEREAARFKRSTRSHPC